MYVQRFVMTIMFMMASCSATKNTTAVQRDDDDDVNECDDGDS